MLALCGQQIRIQDATDAKGLQKTQKNRWHSHQLEGQQRQARYKTTRIPSASFAALLRLLRPY
jgi:hypothetical protein